MSDVQLVPLHDTTRERYVSYALSVITSRALPDVRDGLKPVQRRILYTMFHELSLHPDARYRKCAAVVGDVMGKYHPHGDQSIYDALARMAQDFSLRATLVDPHGNFGSLDGDPPAAMRYTECRLTSLAEELLVEIKKDTVDFRPTYDGQRDEPVVLPAQFPQLLVNGSEGIAVGLATRIPPHHLGEIIEACVAILDGTATSTADLMRYVQGPDFPTGGKILNDAASLLEIYEQGQGSVRIRGTWSTERDGRKTLIVLNDVPYGVNKAKLIEKIGAEVIAKRLPQVLDVRDESTEIVRVVLELKPDADPEAVMAYLYKRTPLETSFPVNMHVLVPAPTEGNPELCVPERCNLFDVLSHWLDFRIATVRRRFTFDLRKLEERIHLLEGFALLFDALDEAIAIIRASEGRKDAHAKLVARFGLSDVQTDAILDLRLYRLARLEIRLILDELEEKRAKAAEIRQILASEVLLTGVVRTELVELGNLYADPRRTVVGEPVLDLDFDETAYLVVEDAVLIVTREGWLKRQNSITDIERVRVREGDEVGWVFRSDTSKTVTFFASDGGAYTARVGDLPATTGYGAPLQKLFSTDDGARLVGVMVHDTAAMPPLLNGPPPEPDDPAGPWLIAVTLQGRVVRLALEALAEPSTRAGRRYARLADGDAVLAVWPAGGGERVSLASAGGNVLVFPLSEVAVLKAAGKGTTAIKLKADDEVLGFELAAAPDAGVEVQTTNGRPVTASEKAFGLGQRAARGHAVIRRGGLTGWTRPLVVGPGVLRAAADGGEGGRGVADEPEEAK